MTRGTHQFGFGGRVGTFENECPFKRTSTPPSSSSAAARPVPGLADFLTGKVNDFGQAHRWPNLHKGEVRFVLWTGHLAGEAATQRELRLALGAHSSTSGCNIGRSRMVLNFDVDTLPARNPKHRVRECASGNSLPRRSWICAEQ